MTLLDMKKKTLGLIEELDPDSPQLTGDPDISAKQNEVINQVMFELARLKKIPRYIEMKVETGEVLTFERLKKECGRDIYQIGCISGVESISRAEGTVHKVITGGTAEIDVFVYPERITEETVDSEYVFELSNDALEIMPYGVAGDLLKSDISAEYGKIYSDRFEQMIQRLDSRYQLPSVTIEGGIEI